jgi:NADH oxidase (H2O2-forming)
LSENKNIVIIGCGAAGGTAAQFARKTNRKNSISIIEKSKYPQYSKCGLPYVISGKISGYANLIEYSEEWFKRAGIDLFLGIEVENIDINNKRVVFKKDESLVEKPYDSLILATGAKPIIPPIKNIFTNKGLIKNVFTLRTIDDAKKISASIEKGKKATIIGGGLIGLEMAEALFIRKMNVTVVEALPQVLPNTLDLEMSKMVLNELTKNIRVFTNHMAIRAENRNDSVERIIIKNNETSEENEIETDLLLIATGQKPDTTLAKNVGCKLNKKGYVIVNNKCETSLKNMYAVGDCTEYKDFVTKKPVQIGLGSIAVRQGITAGINACGREHLLTDGVLQTCTSKIFNLEIAAAGFCSDEQFSGRFSGLSLPPYFPGGKPITVKIFTNKKGRILGAQTVGDNAAQRINTIATAILGELDIETFRKMETAYAPPIAPTLDAVTLAGDVISMKLSRKR